MNKKKKTTKKTLRNVLVVVISVMTLGVGVYGMDKWSGTPAEFNELNNGQSNQEQVFGGSGGTSHTLGSFDITENLTVGGTTTLTGDLTLNSDSDGTGLVAVDGINYTDINPDACTLHWVDCTETASSGNNTADNPCEFTNDTGSNQYVTAVGFLVTSSTASGSALVDVAYGTASDTAGNNIFDDLDLEAGATNAFWVGTGAIHASDTMDADDEQIYTIPTSTASSFSPFILADSSSIWASQGYTDGDGSTLDNVEMGDIEESIFGMWYKWCEAPSIVAADTDS